MMKFIVDCNQNKPEQWLDASLLNHHSSPELPDLESSQDLQMYLEPHLHRTRNNSMTNVLASYSQKKNLLIHIEGNDTHPDNPA